MIIFGRGHYGSNFPYPHLSIRSMLERLVLKNLTQRTSQSVKWTSGARVTIIFFPSLARSLGNRQKIGIQEKCRVAG